MNETKLPENRAYKVTLVVLLSLAAFTTAMKELNRLHGMVSSVHEFTKQWREADLVTRNEKPVVIIESCPNSGLSQISVTAEVDLSDSIAAATDGYVENMDYETVAEPEVGGKADVVAGPRANQKMRQPARAKFAPVRDLKEEVSSVRPTRDWPAFEYKTPDRTLSVEIPMTLVADIKAGAFENGMSQDSILSLLGQIDRKQSQGKAEIRRRELLIKRFERNVSSRRAS